MNGYQRVYFGLSSGLSKPIKVPIGTCDKIKNHINEVTEKLQLKVEQYRDNPPHWTNCSPSSEVPDDVASQYVFEHNRWVRQIYADLSTWSETPPDEYEELTPEFARTIWYGLATLYLTYDRWTEETYVAEMEKCFEVMQGRETDGVGFGEKPLTKRQAAAVIWLFSEYLDRADVRLEVPNGRDYLVTDDEYAWCPKHGAWHYDDVEEHSDDGDPICPAEGCEEYI